MDRVNIALLLLLFVAACNVARALLDMRDDPEWKWGYRIAIVFNGGMFLLALTTLLEIP